MKASTMVGGSGGDGGVEGREGGRARRRVGQRSSRRSRVEAQARVVEEESSRFGDGI